MPLFGTKLLDVQFDDKALIAGVNAATATTLAGTARMARAFDLMAAGGNRATAAVIALSGAASAFDSVALRAAAHATSLGAVVLGLRGGGAVFKGMAVALGAVVTALSGIWGLLLLVAGSFLTAFDWQPITNMTVGLSAANKELDKMAAKLAAQAHEREKIAKQERGKIIETGFAPFTPTDPRSLEAPRLHALGGPTNLANAAFLEEQVSIEERSRDMRKRFQELSEGFRASTGFSLSEAGALPRSALTNNLELRDTLAKARGILAGLNSDWDILRGRSQLAEESRLRQGSALKQFQARQLAGRELSPRESFFGGILDDLRQRESSMGFGMMLPQRLRESLGLAQPTASTGGGFADFSAFRGAGGQGITGVLDKQTRTAELSLDELKQIRMGVEQLTRAGGMG